MSTRTDPGGEPRQTRREKSQERRLHILDEALAVFASAGYRAASTKHIAERVGMSEAGIFYHFPTKSALLQAVLERRDDLARESILADLDEGIEKLRGLLILAERNSRSAGAIELYCVLSAEATAPDHPAHDYFVQRYDALRADLTATYARLERDGMLVEGISPEDAAAGTLGLWDGLQLQYLLDPASVDIPRELAYYFEQLTNVEFRLSESDA